ncbi:unnamed protein product [Ectocarpus fasciculatus]
MGEAKKDLRSDSKPRKGDKQDGTNKKRVKRERKKTKKKPGDRASPSLPLPVPPPNDGMDAEMERMGGRRRDKKSSKKRKKRKGEEKSKKHKRKHTAAAQTARSPTPTNTAACTTAATAASCHCPGKRRNGAKDESTGDCRQSTETGGCLPSSRNNPARAQDPAHATEGDADRPEDRETKASRARAMVPMRPEEYAAQQRTVREVFDEDTGRWRLVKGTGEIIERIVSRQEQQEIQRHASRWGWDHKTLSRDPVGK